MADFIQGISLNGDQIGQATGLNGFQPVTNPHHFGMAGKPAWKE